MPLPSIIHNMKRNIALIIAVVVLGAGAYYSELWFLSRSNSALSATAAIPAITIVAQGDTLPARASLPERIRSQMGTRADGQNQGVTLTALNTTSAKPAGIDFTLSVGEQFYRGKAPTGSTVLDAMRALSSSGNFRFSGSKYPSIGFFVESINGKKNGNEYYWILYINGTSSNTGVSQATINAGDRIEWKYEKGY